MAGEEQVEEASSLAPSASSSSGTSSKRGGSRGRGGGEKKPRKQTKKKKRAGDDDDDEDDQLEVVVDDESRQRHQPLFLAALDSAVVSCGVVDKPGIYQLSQTCKTVLSILRLRVRSVSGRPRVLIELPSFPSARSLAVDFKDRFEESSWSTTTTSWRVESAVVSGSDSMDLSQLQHIKIRVQEPAKPKAPSYSSRGRKQQAPCQSSCSEVVDPFDFMRPHLPVGLQSLNLEHRPIPQDALPGFHAIITTISFPSLLHLTLSSVDVEVLASAIEQHRFPYLQSLDVGNFFATSPASFEANQAKARATSRLLLGLFKDMPHLRSVVLTGTWANDEETNSSPLSCVMNEQGLNLSRFTTFRVFDAPALRLIKLLVASEDTTWEQQTFGAILLASATRVKNLFGVKDREVLMDMLQKAFVNAPSPRRLPFLQAILAVAVVNRSSAEALAFILEQISTLEPANNSQRPLIQHFLEWLGVNDQDRCVLIYGETCDNGAVAFLLVFAYETLFGKSSFGSPKVRQAAKILLADALGSCASNSMIMSATGFTTLELAVKLLQHQHSLPSNATFSLSPTVADLIRTHQGALQHLVETHGLAGDMAILWLKHPPRSLQGLPSVVIESMADELIRQPKRFQCDWFQTAVTYMTTKDYDDPDQTERINSYQVLRDALFKPERWEKFWETIAHELQLSKARPKSNPHALMDLLTCIYNRRPDQPSYPASMAKIAPCINFYDIDWLHGGVDVHKFVEWLLRIFYGGPKAYLDHLIEKEVVPRSQVKGSRVRIHAKTVESLVVPLSLLHPGGDEEATIMHQLVNLAGEDLFERFIKLASSHLDSHRGGFGGRDVVPSRLVHAVGSLSRHSPDFVSKVIDSARFSVDEFCLLSSLVMTYHDVGRKSVKVRQDILSALRFMCIKHGRRFHNVMQDLPMERTGLSVGTYMESYYIDNPATVILKDLKEAYSDMPELFKVRSDYDSDGWSTS